MGKLPMTRAQLEKRRAEEAPEMAPAVPTFAEIWKRSLDHREIAQVNLAETYAAHFAAAGAPGHSQFMLIAKLARMLSESEAR